MSLQSELRKNMKDNSGYLLASNPPLFHTVIEHLIRPFRTNNFDKIVSPEAKGFFYGPVVAYKLNKPFVPIFKSGRVPQEFVLSQEYTDYSHKIKSIDIGKININKGDKILLVDDTFETGESGKAAIKLIEELGGEVIGISVIYNKMKNGDEKYFKKYNFKHLVKMK